MQHDRRRRRAEMALKAYFLAAGLAEPVEPEDLREAMVSLMTDFRHLADGYGWDFEEDAISWSWFEYKRECRL